MLTIPPQPWIPGTGLDLVVGLTAHCSTLIKEEIAHIIQKQRLLSNIVHFQPCAEEILIPVSLCGLCFLVRCSTKDGNKRRQGEMFE